MDTNGYSQKANILLIVGVVALVALGGAVYFYFQYSGLQKQIKDLNQQLLQIQDDKTKIETELAVLKATDLAKEAELLLLKLKTTEQSLSAAVKRTTELETDMNKIKPYADVTTAIERFFSAPFTQKGLVDIDTRISILQDMEVTNRWMTAKATVDFANNGWGPHDFFQTVFLLNSRIKGFLP